MKWSGTSGPRRSMTQALRASSSAGESFSPGIKRVVIPRSNMNDVLIDEKYESQVEILAVDSLDEVLEHALVGKEEKVSLVERLAKVIDTISSGTDKQPSA